MAEVAAFAGVSPVTVSRVLHEPATVAEATRSRVVAAIRELGYVPNLTARSLAATRTGIVAALIPTIDNSLHAEIVQAMTEVVRAAGYHLLLGCTDFSLDQEEELVQAFLARQAEALYLTGIAHTDATRRMLEAARVPVVEVANLTESPIDMVVGYSGRRAAATMTRYLIERGYRRIAYLYSTIGDNDRLRDRLAGVRETLAEAGLLDERLMVETRIGPHEGATALCELMERSPEVEAVFCSTDVIAVGALLECARQGWQIPGRVAIAGFDDLPIAAELHPALTTVRIPRRQMGRIAGELMVRRLAGETVDPAVVDVGFTLVPRASA